MKWINSDVQCAVTHGVGAYTAFSKVVDDAKTSNFFAAMADLTVAFNEMNNVVSKCYTQSHVETLIDETQQVIDLLSDPSTALKVIGTNYITNAGLIGADITKIWLSYLNDDYYGMGNAVGDQLHILLFGKSTAEEDKAVELLVKYVEEVAQSYYQMMVKATPEQIEDGVGGFLDGLYGVKWIDNDVQCAIDHGTKVYTDVLKVVQDIETKNFLGGMVDLALVFTELNGILTKCYSQEHV